MAHQNVDHFRSQILSKWEDHFIVYPDEDIQTLTEELDRVSTDVSGESFLREIWSWVNYVIRAAAANISAPLNGLILTHSEWKIKAAKKAQKLATGQAAKKPTSQPFITSGTLLKKGGGSSIFSRRNWTSRHFTLCRESGVLRYFDDATKKCERGAIQITKDTTVDVTPANLKGKHGRNAKASNEDPFYFSLNPVQDMHTRATRPHPLALRAASKSEFDGWVHSFKEVVHVQEVNSLQFRI